MSDQPEKEMCSSPGCKNEARAAVRTRPDCGSGDYSVVYYDNRKAPKTAARYCKGHTVALVAALANDIIDEDD